MFYSGLKKTFLMLAVLTGSIAVYFSLPLTSVALLTLTATDQNGQRISSGAMATFLDRHGLPIAEITSTTPGSWDNNLHWWSHSSHPASKLRPSDAMRASSVKVTASNCKAATSSVKLVRRYEPLSIAPHGGGAAYFIYRFDQNVVLQCR
jgi:hypothetical protein